MSLSLRPIKDCAEAFEASEPGQPLREQAASHYDAVKAWAFEDINE